MGAELGLMHPRLRKIEQWRRRAGLSKSEVARLASLDRRDVEAMLYVPDPHQVRDLEEAYTEWLDQQENPRAG